MTRRRSRLLAPAAVALFALGGVACSDDGGDDAAPSTSTEVPTPDDSTSTTGGDDDSTTTESEDEAPSTTGDDPEGSTTTEGGPAPDADLLARIPEIEGFDREPSDDSDSGFGEELCDGSAPSVEPADKASVDYQLQGDELDVYLAIYGMRYASDDEAATFYEEFVSTSSGCVDEGLTVDQGTDLDIGDEGQTFALDFGDDGDGAISIATVGDEVWLLSQLGDGSEIDAVIDAFRTAVEG